MANGRTRGCGRQTGPGGIGGSRVGCAGGCEAAIAIADAAKGVLAAMTLAEASAAKPARVAKLAALSLDADLADAVSDAALADVDEVAAQGRYRDATTRAASKRPT